MDQRTMRGSSSPAAQSAGDDPRLTVIFAEGTIRTLPVILSKETRNGGTARQVKGTAFRH